jgi:hypothetical protein
MTRVGAFGVAFFNVFSLSDTHWRKRVLKAGFLPFG